MVQRYIYSAKPEKESYMNKDQSVQNYGANSSMYVGQSNAAIGPGVTTEVRPILQFIAPKIPIGAFIIDQEFAFSIAGIVLVNNPNILYYKLDVNKSLWTEGSGTTGSPTSEAVNWDNYLPGVPWDTVGGDFDNDPIGISASFPAAGRKFVNMDLLNIDSEEYFGLVLVPSWETPPGNGWSQIRAPGLEDPFIRQNIEDPNWFIDCEVEDVSSRYVNIKWTPKSTDQVPDFDNYLVEYSTTGIGGWVTAGTETNITVGEMQFEIVPVGDVDTWDHKNDTWPDGRTLFFRVTLNVDVTFSDTVSRAQSTVSDVVEHTSIPVIRSLRFADPLTGEFKTIAQIELDPDWNWMAWYLDLRSSKLALKWAYDGEETDLATVESLSFSGAYANALIQTPFTVSNQLPVQNSNFNLLNIIPPVDATLGATWANRPGNPLYWVISIAETNGHTRYVGNNTLTANGNLWTRLPVLPQASLQPYTGPAVESGDIVEFDGRPSACVASWASLISQALASEWSRDEPGTLPPSKWQFDNPGNRIWLDPTVSGGTSETLYMKSTPFWKKDFNDNMLGKFVLDNTEFDGLWFNTIMAISIGHTTTNNDNLTLVWTYSATQMVFYLYNGNPYVGGGVLLGSFIHPTPSSYLYIEIVREKEYYEVYIGEDLSNPIWRANTNPIDGNPSIAYSGGGRMVLYAYDTRGVALTFPRIIGLRYIGKPTGMLASEGEGIVLDPDFGDPSDRYTEVYPMGLSMQCDPALATTLVTVDPDFIDPAGGVPVSIRNTSLNVNNSPPVAVVFAPTSAFTGTNVSINGSQSFDPEGSDLLYEFDFGDGSPLLQTTSAIVSHIYAAEGQYTIKLRVKDEVDIWSTFAERQITIIEFSDEIVQLTFLSTNPFTGLDQSRISGLKGTPIPNVAQTYYQNGKASGRMVSVDGHTAQCDNSKTREELIADTKTETDKLDLYYKNGIVVEIVFPYYGTLQGIITNFTGGPNPDNIEVAEWSFDFMEIDELSLGEI